MYLYVTVDSKEANRLRPVTMWLEKPEYDDGEGIFCENNNYTAYGTLELKALPKELKGKIKPGECKRFKIRFE